MLTRRQLFVAGAVSLAAGSAPARAVTRDRRLLVSVLTCPRPAGASYLDGTLAAVDAELADADRILVCDGCPSPERPGWTTLTLKERPPVRGYRENRAPGWAAIWTAFAMDADLLFLEDDVRPVRAGAIDEMARHRVAEGAAFTSFHHRDRAPGLHDAAAFNMSQAVLLPWETIRELWARRDDPALDQTIWVDLAIAEVGRRCAWKFEQTTNLVEHVGTWSAAMPGHRW